MASDAQGYAYIDVALLTKQAEAQIKSLNDALNKIGSGMDKKAPEVVDQMQKSAVSATKSFDNLAKAQETAGLKTSAAVTRLNGYRTALVQNSAAIKAQEANIKTLTATYGADSSQVREATNRLTEMRTQQVLLTAQTGKLGKEIGGLTPAMAGAIDKVNLFSQKTKSIGESMSGIGQTMTIGVTAPIIGGFGLATKAASDYQYQLQDIRKEVVAQGYSTQQTNAIMKQLSTDTLSWSKQFGVGTKEINDGMFELVSNGYNVKQAMGMMPGLLKTMTANSDKSGESIKLTASMLEQFGMNLGSNSTVIKNGNSLMNQMTEATHKSAMSLDDLKEISGNAGASMHAMGVSTSDFMAVAGRLKSAGIDASSVGTGLSAMMTRLGTGTGQAAADLKKYNIQIFDGNGKMKSMFDILGQMQTAYKGMNDQERQKFMYDTIGQENMKVGMTLMDANLDRYKSLSSEIQNSTGTVDKYNKTMRDTNQFTQQQFQSSLKALEIEFGQKLLPTLTPLIKDFTEMINKFSEMDSGTQQLIIKAGLLAAAGGPILTVTGKLISGIGSLTGGSVKLLAGLAKISPLMGTVVKDGGAASKVLAGLGTASEVGSGSLLTLGGSIGTTVAGLGSLALAAAPVALGVAAVGTAAYFAIKSAKEHEAENERYKKSMDTFGTNISDNSQKAIKSFNKLHSEAQNDMAQLDTATVSQAKTLAAGVSDKYGKMADMVIGKFDQTKTKSLNTLSQISASFGAAGAEWENNVAAGINSGYDKQISKLTDAKKTISDLLTKVGGDLSKLSADEREQLQDAQKYISDQTSAFGVAYNDQIKLQQQYNNNHNYLTNEMFDKDIKTANDAYDKATKAAKKTYSERLKALEQSNMTESQLNEAKAMLDAERNQQETKASIELTNTQTATYEHYKNTGNQYLQFRGTVSEKATTLDTAQTKELQDSSGKWYKVYYDYVAKDYVTKKQWVADAKKANDDYIAKQKKSHGSIEDQLDKFAQKQEKAYEKMGLDRQQAKLQADSDADDMYSELTKQGSKIAKAGQANHDSYIDGLNKGNLGDPGQVATQWGLDLTDTVQTYDLGKYGTKTAQEFWDDFKSGSKKGQAEAKLYFASIMSDLKSENLTSINDLDADTKQQLLAGLEAGAVSIKTLKGQFHDSILDLFPSDLSKAGTQGIKSLSMAYQNGMLSLSALKNKFGNQVYQLFPDDLGKLGKNELKTLSDSYKNGSIADQNAIKQKYSAQLNSIYSKDLGQLGTENIKTLQTALKLGITNEAEIKSDFAQTLQRIYSEAPTLDKIGAQNMATLKQGLKLGAWDVNDLQNQYKTQLDTVFNKSLSDYGKGDIETLANGISLNLPEAQAAMKKIQDTVGNGAKINLAGEGSFTISSLVSAYQNGKISVDKFMAGLQEFVKNELDVDATVQGSNTTGTYKNGMLNKKQEVYAAAGVLASGAVDNLEIAGNANGKGVAGATGFGTGLYNGSGYPLSVSAGTAGGVIDNYNLAIDSANNLSSNLGGKSTAKRYSGKPSVNMQTGFGGLHAAHGTNGKVLVDQPAVVGDGGKEELIDYGNGQIGLSPNIPTFTMLPAGAQVFSGDDTDKVRPIMQSLGVPMFAKGTGGSIVDWIKKLFGDAMSFIEHPIDNWKKLVDNTYDMTPFGADHSTIGSSGKEFEKKQTNWLDVLKKKMEAEAVAGPAGSGAERWASVVKKVGDAMGQNPTAGEISRIINVIDHESNGNPSITQSAGVWDINMANGTPARGLLQFIPRTFQSYMVPGHTNILSGEDQLYAMFNDTNWRSDVKTGGWGPTGGRRLALGQHVTKEIPALIGDNPQHDEFVINGYAGNAGTLTSELLDQMAQVNPAALQQVKLPKTMFASPEAVSGYQPSTQMFSQSGATNNGSSNDLTAATHALVDGLQKAQGKIEIHLDGYVEQVVYPLVKQLLGRDQIATINRLGGIH